MTKTQLSFDYEDFDSTTQDFLQQKTIEIKSLSRSLTSKSNRLILKTVYAIGEKLVEVRDDSNESCKPYFQAWLTNEILPEFQTKTMGKCYNYIYLYQYTSKYLGGVGKARASTM